jgi:hypothetical protein
LPEWATKRPELQRDDPFYINAFWELSSCRQYSQGAIGPIPWTAISEYADRHSLDHVVRRVFLEVVRGLDATWLEWQLSQRSKPRR